jgi:hypothetical protein
VNYTRVSKKEAFSKVFVPSTTLFEFVSSPALGHFLATVDVRRGEELDTESSLKFFE